MSRQADGKTRLAVECLAKVPIPESGIQVVYDSLNKDSSNIEVLRIWLKNVCLSHERLRAELSGVEIIRDEDQQRIREAAVNLDAGNYRKARELLMSMIPRTEVT